MFNLASKNYDYLAEKGYLVSEKGENEPYVMSPYWAGDASMLDITNPGAQDWLWKQFHRLLSEGVDGLWVDLTEPEYTIENGEFYLGPEKKVHNVYNNIFAETIYEGWRKDFPDKRVFNLTRAGFAGIQRYGAVNWSGDASKTWIALKNVTAKLDEIPVFAKQSSVIPLGKVKKHVGASKDDTLTCRIYPGGDAAFEPQRGKLTVHVNAIAAVGANLKIKHAQLK
ncbi:MAG: hypothetical protein K9G70_01440 [Prolixibacteraceae bacterium]|nr:hypothetical protein [Prolixibacteraceae bacterium]